jgi:hypothetical protein
MTANRDPYENAIAERFNGILKEEFYPSETFASHEDAARHIAQSIQIYNTRRPHLTCNMMTPELAHQARSLNLKSWEGKAEKGPTARSCEPSSPHPKKCKVLLGRDMGKHFGYRINIILRDCTNSPVCNL